MLHAAIRILILPAALVAATACTGTIESAGLSGGAPDQPGPPGSSPGGSSGTPGLPGEVVPPGVEKLPSACTGQTSLTLGKTPLRRLNNTEYDNTVKDLLGTALRPSVDFRADDLALSFDSIAEEMRVDNARLEGYAAAAAQLAAEAVQNLSRIVPCTPAGNADEACATRFITEFGRRAFRRPLDAAVVARYLAVFKVDSTATFATRVGLILEAMLQSPRFLYRAELANGDAGMVKLDAWEIASRLSYLLWRTMPDDRLFAAAAAGTLTDPAVVATEVERMLADPRARAMTSRFHSMWLGLDGIPLLTRNDPSFDGARLLPLMKQEMEKFFDHVVWDGEGDLKTMLTAPYTFMNRELGAFYAKAGGMENPSATLPISVFAKVPLDPTKRAGFMSQAGFLTGHAGPQISAPITPVRRGAFIRAQIACAPVAPPPANVDTSVPQPGPGVTNRDALTVKTSEGTCFACHQLLNPIGFAFENYDSLGRWRDTDNGRPVDASGEIPEAEDPALRGAFRGAPELAAKLAQSEQVAGCMATQWFRFAYGRLETEADQCTVELLRAGMDAGAGKILALLKALTQVDAFYHANLQGGQP